MDELNKFVNLLLQAAVAALAPVAVAYVIATLRSLRDRAKAALSVEQWSIVEAVAATVVSAAEQSGLANHIVAEGRSKKEWAIAEATRILARYGLSVDLATLSALIEAEVFRQLNDAATREHKASLQARVNQMEQQIAAMWAWATRQPHPPQMPHERNVESRAIEAMRTLFTREELEVLAHDIGARLEDVGGETLSAIAHRLWNYAAARQMTASLIAAIRKHRPNANV